MRPEYPLEAPEYGEVIEVSKGVFWLRIPLPMALDHINIYWLIDDDGVTIVDTGLQTPELIKMWKKVIEKYIAPQPIKRVILTHYHPDHSGLIGWFIREHGAELWTSRMTYLLTRMLLLDVQDRPTEHHARHWARVGYDADWIDAKMNQRPFNFQDAAAMIPLGFRSLGAGEVVTLAGRKWTVRFGQGHAPDHVTLWSDDLVLIGDQCLPAITPVISVFPTEPNADPLGEFTRASEELAGYANDTQLFLCGHNRPFFGGKSRLLALATHHYDTLDKLREALKTPKTMIECYPLLFKRKITAQNEGFAISEAAAHFNHLEQLGEIKPFSENGITKWKLRA